MSSCCIPCTLHLGGEELGGIPVVYPDAAVGPLRTPVATSRMTVVPPAGLGAKNFSGMCTSTGVPLARVQPLPKTMVTMVLLPLMVAVDPVQFASPAVTVTVASSGETAANTAALGTGEVLVTARVRLRMLSSAVTGVKLMFMWGTTPAKTLLMARLSCMTSGPAGTAMDSMRGEEERRAK